MSIFSIAPKRPSELEAYSSEKAEETCLLKVGNYFAQCPKKTVNLELAKKFLPKFSPRTRRKHFCSLTVVVYKKAYDTSRAGRILVRHQPLPQNHKNTIHRVYNYTITNN